MRLATALLSLAAVGIFASAAHAYIPPRAVEASHDLELAAEAIHDYLHDAGYPSSYGAHGLDDAAVVLHDTLHDWEQGNASEADVVAARDAYCDAFANFLQTIIPAGVLFQGDTGLDRAFIDVVRKTIRMKVLLAFARA